jgi:sodium/proline symporter
LSADLRGTRRDKSLEGAHLSLLLIGILGLICALFLPQSLLVPSAFAWNALGAAFGPLLLLRLCGMPLRTGATLGSMWAGFTLTFVFYLLPDSPGDLFERVLPFVTALGIALTGGERRDDPDRQDRVA